MDVHSDVIIIMTVELQDHPIHAVRLPMNKWVSVQVYLNLVQLPQYQTALLSTRQHVWQHTMHLAWEKYFCTLLKHTFSSRQNEDMQSGRTSTSLSSTIFFLTKTASATCGSTNHAEKHYCKTRQIYRQYVHTHSHVWELHNRSVWVCSANYTMI